jgi:hypothetical protein
MGPLGTGHRHMLTVSTTSTRGCAASTVGQSNTVAAALTSKPVQAYSPPIYWIVSLHSKLPRGRGATVDQPRLVPG